MKRESKQKLNADKFGLMCNLIDEGYCEILTSVFSVIFRPSFSGLTWTSQSVVTFVADHSTCVLTHTHTLIHSHSLSLSLYHTHTHTHTHIHTHSLSFSLSHIHTLYLSFTHSHVHTLSLNLSHIQGLLIRAWLHYIIRRCENLNSCFDIVRG